MRLGWTKNKNSTTYRAVKTIRVNGKNQPLVIKTFGSDKFICETYGVPDAKAWALEQVRIMNEEEKEETPSFDFSLHSGTDLPLDTQRCFNGGYLFLQQVYYELGLDRICAMIRTRHGFTYNLNSILSRLVYTRILSIPRPLRRKLPLKIFTPVSISTTPKILRDTAFPFRTW